MRSRLHLAASNTPESLMAGLNCPLLRRPVALSASISHLFYLASPPPAALPPASAQRKREKPLY
jgi:hypothetical protein|tara:strand:+ start:1753 stop:1944 length:192 start_codon:yes stop_codon:yes gene_type:complete